MDQVYEVLELQYVDLIGVEVEEVYNLPYVIEQEWIKSMKVLELQYVDLIGVEVKEVYKLPVCYWTRSGSSL